MSAPDDYRGPKFVGIMGHDNVSHNGSKTTVYFVQVQVADGMFIVRHRYHEFKDFYDKVRTSGRYFFKEGKRDALSSDMGTTQCRL